MASPTRPAYGRPCGSTVYAYGLVRERRMRPRKTGHAAVGSSGGVRGAVEFQVLLRHSGRLAPGRQIVFSFQHDLPAGDAQLYSGILLCAIRRQRPFGLALDRPSGR